MNTYMVVVAVSLHQLAQAVNDATTEGWRPEGGVTFAMGDYLQVMVRETE